MLCWRKLESILFVQSNGHCRKINNQVLGLMIKWEWDMKSWQFSPNFRRLVMLVFILGSNLHLAWRQKVGKETGIGYLLRAQSAREKKPPLSRNCLLDIKTKPSITMNEKKKYNNKSWFGSMHGYRFTANIEAQKHCMQLMCILKTGLKRQRCRLYLSHKLDIFLYIEKYTFN